MRKALNIRDLREMARRRLTKSLFDFCDKGSEDQISMRDTWRFGHFNEPTRIEGTKIVVEVEEERSPDIVRVSCAKPKAGPRKKPGDDGQGSLL